MHERQSEESSGELKTLRFESVSNQIYAIERGLIEEIFSSVDFRVCFSQPTHASRYTHTRGTHTRG